MKFRAMRGKSRRSDNINISKVERQHIEKRLQLKKTKGKYPVYSNHLKIGKTKAERKSQPKGGNRQLTEKETQKAFKSVKRQL